MNHEASVRLRLTLARAIAWMLLLSGWVGLGSISMFLAPSLLVGFALIALWLLAVGAAATIATRDNLSSTTRRSALAVCALTTATALVGSLQGLGLSALVAALVGWAALTALASGVVRRLRRMQAGPPGAPVVAASLGALVAGLALSDLSNSRELSLRLAVLVALAGMALMLLQVRENPQAQATRCRAGLFDCSLPAWPSGAWSDVHQWPVLFAGLAMLPMMAALPLMVAWCRLQGLPSALVVLAHFGAMFVPALVLRHALASWSGATLAAVCALLLGAGAGFMLWMPAPWNVLMLVLAHGSAWGIAWAAQLWAPERRAQRGTSPLPAAFGYAAFTVFCGIVIDRAGAAGVGFAHVTLGVIALAAWLVGLLLVPNNSAHPGS